MNRFDQAAATWDEDPVRRERAQKLAAELRPLIRQHQLKSGLDFGGGTGLVSFFLLDDLEQIDVVDVSEGMIAEAKKKAETLGITHLHAHAADLTASDWPHRYDCIYTLLTLHHIRDVEGALKRFYDLLNPGGILCIADLDQEDGSFHSEYPDFDGHNGFDQQALSKLLQEAGFSNVQSRHFYTLEKQEKDGSKREYPLFFMSGVK